VGLLVVAGVEPSNFHFVLRAPVKPARL
jgi:hypothetical protein